MNPIQSASLQTMHLENLIFNLVPAAILDKHGDSIDKLDQYDIDIANLSYKIEQLKVKRLRAKCDLIGACINDMPFDQAKALVRAATMVNPNFINHAEVIMWIKQHSKELNHEITAL